jgi:hypothetical protein
MTAEAMMTVDGMTVGFITAFQCRHNDAMWVTEDE